MSVYVKRVKANGINVITSSCYDDIRTLRESLRDSNISNMKHDKNCHFDIGALQLAATAQIIALWHEGTRELNDYVTKLGKDRWQHYETQYMGVDIDPNDNSVVPELTDEELYAFKQAHKTKRMKFN